MALHRLYVAKPQSDAVMTFDTIIMVHGAGGGGWEYKFWAPVFEKAGWNVVARDLLPAPGGLTKTSVDDYVRQVVAWAPRRRGRLVLVGASMGGALAIKAAERLRPDAIVLVNPVPSTGMPNRKVSPPVVLWANGAYRDTVESMPDSDEPTRRFAWKRWRNESGAVLNGLRKGIGAQAPRCPVLMVISGRDTDVPPALSRATAKRLKAQVKTLPKASHVGPLLAKDAPQVAASVLRWLR